MRTKQEIIDEINRCKASIESYSKQFNMGLITELEYLELCNKEKSFISCFNWVLNKTDSYE